MKIVLDTNIALDWLVFADPLTRFLDDARLSRHIEIVVNTAVIAEMKRVLAYSQFNLDPARQQEILAKYELRAYRWEMPVNFSLANLQLPAGFPHCRDSDDDHFLALAHHAGATLVTKDKALLRLRKKAGRFGVGVETLGGLRSMLEAAP